MKGFKKTFLEIYREDRSIFLFIFGNFLAGLALFVFSLFNLSPDSAVVKISYGDIGGYVDGSWTDMLVFPILSVVFGVVHGAISILVFKKYGVAMCKVFLVISMLLSAGGLIVLLRLVGEG